MYSKIKILKSKEKINSGKEEKVKMKDVWKEHEPNLGFKID